MSSSCPKCGRSYGKRKRCYYCHGRPRTGESATCLVCGNEMLVPAWKKRTGQGKYCSYACHYEAMRGKELKQGTRYVRADGYVQIKTGIRKAAMEHRLVMEKELGRPLRVDEHVHHLNGVRSDNRLGNLRVVGASEHSGITNRSAARRHRAERAELAEYRRRYGPL